MLIKYGREVKFKGLAMNEVLFCVLTGELESHIDEKDPLPPNTFVTSVDGSAIIFKRIETIPELWMYFITHDRRLFRIRNNSCLYSYVDDFSFWNNRPVLSDPKCATSCAPASVSHALTDPGVIMLREFFGFDISDREGLDQFLDALNDEESLSEIYHFLKRIDGYNAPFRLPF